METQDHKKPGSSGHGGNHVCSKCGWSFPNAHPSSRHRRAHRKVCGTIEGFKLDIVNGSHGDKAHGAGSDGEHGSDDEHKTPSKKVEESGIIRKSSSGVGSRSSRSNRSEDEMFADAATEFNETPAPVPSRGSGGLERFYSMQNANESEETQESMPAKENPIADHLSIPETDLLKDDQLQFLQTFEGEDKIELGGVLHEYSSTNPTLHPVSVSVKSENAVQQKVMQFSEPSSELNVAAGGGEEILSSEKPSGLSSLNSGTGEVVAFSKVANGELQDTVSFGMADQTRPVLIDAEGYSKKSCDKESPEKDNTANIDEVDPTGDFNSPVREVQVTDSGNRNSRKSDAVEVRNSHEGPDNYIHSVAVPDALPLPEHTAIEPEDINHERGKFHDLKVEDSTLPAKVPEDNRPGAMKESDTSFDMTETADSHSFSPDGTDLAKNAPLMEDVHDQGSDVGVHYLNNEEIRASRNSSVKNDKVSYTEEQKAIPLAGKVNAGGNAMDDGHIQETASNIDTKATDIALDDREQFVLHESDAYKASEGVSTVRDWFGELAISKVPSQVKEQIIIHESNDMVDNENIKLKGDALSGNKTRSDGERETEYVSSETEPACRENISVYHDSISKAGNQDDIFEVSKLDKKSDPLNSMAHQPLAESSEVSTCATEIVGIGKNVTQGECLVERDTGVVKSESCADSLEVGEHVDSPLRSSSGLDDKVIEPHTAVSGVDAVVETGSQAFSLDGNWGSFSVLSVASDVQPATDTPSNYSQTMAVEETVSLERNSVTDNQNAQSHTSLEPHAGKKQMEKASEIQTSTELQETSNEPLKGKSNAEIIEKVTNWSAGKQQHTALKTLLVEATAKSRAESPLHHNHGSTSETKTEETPITNNSLLAKTEDATLRSKNPEEASQEEMGQEWNSPARYPVNIKSEKRTKSRPYWAPFLCCSSVNAR